MVTKVLKVDPKSPDPRIFEEAARILERGGLVVFPTETVYGIAANLLNRDAVERLKVLKSRDETKQFSIHIGAKSDVEKYAVQILPRAYKVMERFWPGPLTVVLNAPAGRSVGLRMPKNEVALRLLGYVDFPVIVPSANLAGRPAPQDAAAALKDLDGRVDMVLDAGPTSLGRESTVLDARTLPFSVLREGGLKKEDVLAVAGQATVLFVCTGNSCRSVMAQYLLQGKMKEKGRQDVEAISAGTFAMFGMSPTRETLKLVEGFGQDASGHRAQRLTPALIRSSDFILAMEKRHQEEVHAEKSASKNKEGNK